MVEGSRLVRQALDAGWTVLEQYVGSRAETAIIDGIPVHHLGPNVLERVATTETPPDLLAVVVRGDAALPGSPSFVIAADELGDPGNAGTILRTAEAAGADGVVLTPGSVDVFNPKVIRASAGSVFRVPAEESTLAELADRGLALVATSSHRGECYTAFDWRAPVAIVLGNESRGLAVDAPVEHWVQIPQAGQVESLNVAMAATVLAFEVARQRRAR